MNVGPFVLATFLATAASAAGDGRSEQLMGEIEKQVRLPNGARPLHDYARYYAHAANGKVIGVYVLAEPRVPRGSVYGCEETIFNGDRLTSKSIPCPPELGAGERRWLGGDGRLPTISDGGCAVVTVVFNPSTHRIERAACNGVG